jgi:hypothetical protein
VCLAPPSWGRHPQTFTIADSCTAAKRIAISITSVSDGEQIDGRFPILSDHIMRILLVGGRNPDEAEAVQRGQMNEAMQHPQ